MPLKILAIDDEPLAIERLQILCTAIPDVQLIGTAHDGDAALRLIEALQPDLLLLDIAMPGMSGLELAQRLPAPAPLVIFVTAYDKFAVAAFDVAAVDYLMKPIERERLARAIDRARDRIAERQGNATAPASPWIDEFWVPHRGEVIRISAVDVQHVEAERDYMRLHCGNRSFLIHETISTLEKRLDPQRFLRIHRSTIVRRDMVARLVRDGGGAGSVVLTSDVTLPVGRTYAIAVRQMIGR
jgi:two-component system response regulator AlgR